ncbi:MAG: 23S rRNA (pseudouridine(1915)-N(3))-methyltransferase RlmH [Paludibacteraceae bacterium]|jgi:23S rRNA (pseudouridine1915-N3)-methyltransferase|nr:23S rRNA (pseudouridine(1915)-N(3))-methyltransferase RlmH [Paludibacteraceae bacterium]
MKITLLVVGKTTNAALDSLIADYQKRLTHYVPFALQVLPELKNAKALSFEQQKQLEGEMILRAVGSSAYVILLDEHGSEFRSVEFADRLQKWMAAGRDIVFVVGGPYGFSPDVYARANAQIALSKMTFSHQMVRLVFVEQIYRAMTILRGEPYHHE